MKRLAIGKHLHATDAPQNLLELDAAASVARTEYLRALRNLRT